MYSIYSKMLNPTNTETAMRMSKRYSIWIWIPLRIAYIAIHSTNWNFWLLLHLTSLH